MRLRGMFVLLMGLWLPQAAPAQPIVIDTTAAAHTPRGALVRAAVPGWGQLYNGQRWKIPVVYAGLAGFTGLALATNQDYLLHRHAYLYRVHEEMIGRDSTLTNPWPQYADDYARLTQQLADGADVSASVLQNRRDGLRRNRDLLYFGIGLWYGLSVLDAYVSAHLFDFDVGEDLSVALHPHPRGLAATVRFGR